jgi:hypothetical protein
MEGPYGFNATYDIHLRPCSIQLLDNIKVTMITSVESQLILNSTVLTGNIVSVISLITNLLVLNLNSNYLFQQLIFSMLLLKQNLALVS